MSTLAEHDACTSFSDGALEPEEGGEADAALATGIDRRHLSHSHYTVYAEPPIQGTHRVECTIQDDSYACRYSTTGSGTGLGVCGFALDTTSRKDELLGLGSWEMMAQGTMDEVSTAWLTAHDGHEWLFGTAECRSTIKLHE